MACSFDQLESRILLSGTITPTFVRFRGANGIIPAASAAPSGVPPTTMRTAYAVNQALFGGVVGDGTGQTIAIVDAYNQPNIVSDLAAFDSAYGIQAPPSFTVVGQSGSTLPSNAPTGGWGVEISLDVEWAHVIAPNAGILLVEANSAGTSDLYTAVDRARNYAGVSIVSMSWGGDETSSDAAFYNSHFTTPSGHVPVTFIASSGDSGSYSQSSETTQIVEYPAASVNVIGVGGTTLTTGTGGAYSSETGWGNGTSSFAQSLGGSGGSGGGLSLYAAQPSYQSGIVSQSTTKRAVPDVAFDADPNSGVPVYDSYDDAPSTPWIQVGGTSLAAPMWAGVIAIADQGRAYYGLSTLDGPSQTLPAIYALPAADFHDITSGNNGYAAGPGYDLVTGRGTPIVNLVVRDLAAPAAITISAFTVTPSSATVGSTVTLTASGVAPTSGATLTGVNFYLESNSTAGLQIGSDTLLGSGASSGSTFTLSFSTTTINPGTYTYYAVATDSTNATVTSTGTLVLNAPTPTIGSFTITPSATVIGNTVTLTAASVTEPYGSIGNVKFYRETNGTTGLQIGSDTLLGTGTSSGTTFTLSFSTAGFSPSTTTYYAVATDPQNVTATASAALTLVTPLPLIGSFAANPASATAGAPVTLTATNVTETDGTIGNVRFYLESNATAGLQIGSDTLLGTGTGSGTTFTFSAATTGMAPGTYTYYAVATDTLNITTTASATLVLTAPVPSIGSFALSPASIVVGSASTTLTASNVTEAYGSISNVKFYLESNATTGLQTASDTFLGVGTSSGTTWTFSPSTASLTVGTYTFYALATDASGATTTASALLTVTNPTTPFTAGWNVAAQTDFGTQGLLATTISTGASNTTGLTRGASITTNQTSSSVAGGWGGETWQTGVSTVTGAQSITFGLTVSSGYSLSLSSLAMNYRVGNSAGPTNGYWQYQINGGTWNLIANVTGEFTISSAGGAIAPLNLSTVAGLQNLASGTAVTFRLTPYGGANIHTWFIYHTGATTNDLVINGTAATLGGITPAADFNLSAATGNLYTLTTSGPVTLNSDLSTQGTINLSVGAGTVTTLNASQHLSSLTIAAGATVSMSGISGAILNVQSLTIAAGGKLNLGGNYLDVTASSLTAIRTLLKSGQIYTSLSTGALPLTGLAYFRGIDYTNLFGPGTLFAGQSVNPTDLLVQYAKIGDTNLDNAITTDDYLNMDLSFLIPPANITWLSGDFNYDGTVNAADYALLDNAYKNPTTLSAGTTTLAPSLTTGNTSDTTTTPRAANTVPTTTTPPPVAPTIPPAPVVVPVAPPASTTVALLPIVPPVLPVISISSPHPVAPPAPPPAPNAPQWHSAETPPPSPPATFLPMLSIPNPLAFSIWTLPAQSFPQYRFLSVFHPVPALKPPPRRPPS